MENRISYNRLIPGDSRFDDLCGNASRQRILRNITCNNSPRCDDGSTANRHTFQNGNIHANPNMVADDNRLRHRFVRTDDCMVITVPDGDILTDDNTLTNGDALKATKIQVVIDVSAAQFECRTPVYINLST